MKILPIFICSIISGLYTSLWGGYKDSPYEGFKIRAFPRSIYFSAVIFLTLLTLFQDRLQSLSFFQIFFLIMGIERVTSEIYKGFFRNEDQGKYLIPSRFTLFGRHIANNTILYCLGITLIAGLIAILCIKIEIDHFAGFLTASCCSGFAVALGGAYKDAPFEGFKLINFLKSPLILLFTSPLFYIWGSASLGFLIIMNIGLERFIVEYYKTYVQRSMSGKFNPDIQRCQIAVETRGKYHFISLLIILGLVILLFNRLRYPL